MKRYFFTFIFIIPFFYPLFGQGIYADWKIENDNWYSIHSTDPGFMTTSSGLCYKVIYQGWEDNRKPNINSCVKITYKGKLIDGSVFDSGNAQQIELRYAIQGLREGISKMNDGGEFIFYIPYSLAYNEKKCCEGIIPYSVLIFEITLIESFN